MPTCPQCHVDHRGLCHQCVHNGKVYGDYRLSPCSSCRPAEALQQGHGRNVSYDEIAPVLGERPKKVDPEPEDRALDVLRAFLGLDAIGREIIFTALREPETSLQQIANYLQVTFRRPFTLQAVHWRIRTMQRLGATFERVLARVDRRVG